MPSKETTSFIKVNGQFFISASPVNRPHGSIAFAARVQTSADVCSIPAGDWFLLICISWPRLITGKHFDLGRILFKCYRNKERNVLVSISYTYHYTIAVRLFYKGTSGGPQGLKRNRKKQELDDSCNLSWETAIESRYDVIVFCNNNHDGTLRFINHEQIVGEGRWTD